MTSYDLSWPESSVQYWQNLSPGLLYWSGMPQDWQELMITGEKNTRR